MSQLIDVRCPLPSKGRPDKVCNKLCVRVMPGSSGRAFCPRHESEFEFQVDDARSFNDSSYTQPTPSVEYLDAP